MLRRKGVNLLRRRGVNFSVFSTLDANTNNTYNVNADGTSFAAPLIAGAAACYWQQHKTLSNIEILNRIKSKSSFAQKPNNRIGWGVPNLCMPLTDLDFTLAWIKELKGVRIRLSETYYSELHLKIYK